MHEDLFPYYESELLYLRQAGAEFAEKYPAEAGALKLNANGSTDPHIERLLEGVALLGARIRRKLDDEFPELTNALLGMLCPHMIAPIPAVGIAQFDVNERSSVLSANYKISREIPLDTPPPYLQGKFRTCFPVELLPIKVSQVDLTRPDEMYSYEREYDAIPQAQLTLKFDALHDATLSNLETDKIRFYLNGAPLSFRLYELLFTNVLCGDIVWRDENGIPQSKHFKPSAITPVGFSREESLLPPGHNTFDGYRILHEYFAYQEKFLFVDITVPDMFRHMETNDSFELKLYLKQTPSFAGEQKVTPNHFLLGCTPVINLFKKISEPFKTTPAKREYKLIPEINKREDFETYSIQNVTLTDLNERKSYDLSPFYSFSHSVNDEHSLFWHTRQDLDHDGALEFYLQFSTLGFSPVALSDSTISAEILCSNRNKMKEINWNGARFTVSSGDVPTFGDIKVINMQQEPIRTPLGRDDEFWNGASNNKKLWRGAYWRLISHLSLNYLSIEEGGIESLRALLQLYDIKGLIQNENMILGLLDISTNPMGAIVNGSYCRGLDIELTIDPTRFGGSSSILLSAVLDHFFSRYATINSMVRLTIKEEGKRGRILKRWPIRAGKQSIL